MGSGTLSVFVLASSFLRVVATHCKGGTVWCGVRRERGRGDLQLHQVAREGGRRGDLLGSHFLNFQPERK